MRRLILSLLLVVLVAILGFGWGFDKLYEEYAKPAEENQFKDFTFLAKHLAKVIEQSPDQKLFLQQWQVDSKLSLSLIDLSNLPLPPELLTSFKQGNAITLQSETGVLLHILLANKQQVLRLKIPVEEHDTDTQNLNLIFTLLFYLGVLLLTLLWLYPLVRRLQLMSRAARAFGEGQLSIRIKTNETSYIKDIETEFNHMAERIETLMRDNKLLSTAVSHDLRTPLARLRFGIETVIEIDDVEKQNHYLHRISDDISEMESLVEILLNYARLDQNMQDIKLRNIDLAALVQKSVSTAAVHSNHEILFKPENTSFQLHGNAHYLSMLSNNLLQNAINHGNQRILVTLKKTKSGYLLSIADDGPGIPQQQREEVLKPFTRGKNTHKKSGYGMGLAIVSRITKWHHGSLLIEQSDRLGGAKISVLLPN